MWISAHLPVAYLLVLGKLELCNVSVLLSSFCLLFFVGFSVSSLLLMIVLILLRLYNTQDFSLCACISNDISFFKWNDAYKNAGVVGGLYQYPRMQNCINLHKNCAGHVE